MAKEQFLMTVGNDIDNNPVRIDLNATKIAGGIAVIGVDADNRIKVVQSWMTKLLTDYDAKQVGLIVFGDENKWIKNAFDVKSHYFKFIAHTDDAEEQFKALKALNSVIVSRTSGVGNVPPEYEKIAQVEHLIVVNDSFSSDLFNARGEYRGLEEEYRSFWRNEAMLAREAGVTFILADGRADNLAFPRDVRECLGERFVMRTDNNCDVKRGLGLTEELDEVKKLYSALLPDGVAYFKHGEGAKVELINADINGLPTGIDSFAQMLKTKQANADKMDGDLAISMLSELKDVKVELTLGQLQEIIRKVVNEMKRQ